jgi:succinate dehydrogenase/fumarate reductase flavoprotein subunit
MSDVVVLGTGAGGLTAALAARHAGRTVWVYEKADRVGGTGAWSGGMIWIPNNHQMRAAGISAASYVTGAVVPVVDGGFLAP